MIEARHDVWRGLMNLDPTSRTDLFTSSNDIQATLLHLLGLDHTRLTYRFQGRDYRLTDVSGRMAAEEILA